MRVNKSFFRENFSMLETVFIINVQKSPFPVLIKTKTSQIKADKHDDALNNQSSELSFLRKFAYGTCGMLVVFYSNFIKGSIYI